MLLHALTRRKSIDKIIAAHEAGESEHSSHGLKRSLTVWDLTSFGIAAIILANVQDALIR